MGTEKQWTDQEHAAQPIWLIMSFHDAEHFSDPAAAAVGVSAVETHAQFVMAVFPDQIGGLLNEGQGLRTVFDGQCDPGLFAA